MASQPQSKKIYWFLVLVFAFFSMAVGTAGYFFYDHQKKSLKQEKWDQISAIASLKARQITDWRRDRMEDAHVILDSSLLTHHFQQFLKNPKATDVRQELLEFMTSLQKRYHYQRIFLLDATGMVRLSAPEGIEVIGPDVKKLGLEAMREKKVILSDLYRSEMTHLIRISLLVPLLVPQGKDVLPVGVLLLRIDPYQFIYPLLQSWPTPSRSSESLLVRREGNEVLFLNDLVHKRDTALKFRLPISEKRLPAVMAVLGKEGIVEGVDYRGVLVLAAIRPIPDSPWYLVAKVDQEEIYAPIRTRIRLIASIIGLLIAGAGLIVGLFWRHQRAEQYKRQYEAEREHRVLTQRYEYLTRHANDIILLMDQDLKIVEANERALEYYGYSHEELLQMNLRDLRAPETLSLLEAQLDQVKKQNGAKIETFHQRKDGTRFPVENSSRVIEVDGKTYYQSIIRDVTERKQNEEILRQSEERFRELFNEAPVGYHEVDSEGRIVRINRTGLDMLGYTAEEILGQYVWEFIIEEESYQKVMGKLTGTIPVGGSFEHTYQRKDGTILPVLIEERLLRDPEGRIIGIRSTIEDITERKWAEEALRESEERYRTLVEESFDGIFIQKGPKIIFANQRLYEMLGYDKGEIEGLDHWLLYHPDYQNLTRERARARMRGEKVTSQYEVKFQRKNGTFFDGEISARLIMFGNEPGIQVWVKDITEQKRAMEALRASEEKLQELFDNAPIGYFEYDSLGCITNVNRTELEMLGYSLEEMIGQPAWRFIVEEEEARQQILAKLADTMPPGKGFERTYKRRDGTIFTALCENRVLRDPEGKIIGIRSTIQDITERKWAEREKAVLQEQLRQSQKMEGIGRLAGGIAHDFNNLLTVIKGYTQLSLLELKEESPLKGNIEEVKGATDKATDLVRQLLAFSRRQILEMKVLDLNIVLRNLDKMLRRVIGEDIELVTLLADDLGRVKTDPGWIEQVIMNLSVNARDAMPKGGKLTIETANVELDEDYARRHVAVRPGRYVMLSISDTGEGMTPEVRERLFEPFFTTKEKDKGTGLGLSTVYGIVKQSGGNIWVYSEPGRGTTFKIYLPRLDEPLDEFKEKVVKEELLRGDETILVVEDDEEVRRLAVRILKRQGYMVLEASQGIDAFLICEEHEGPIHLLVTDVVMPKMNGRELAERIESIRPEIKVLYISGYTDNAVIQHGVLGEGMNYIQKPFTVDGLAKKVREVLNK